MSAAIRAWVSETRSGKRSCLVNTGEPSFDVALLEPPDPELVGRAGDDVGLAVVVHVVGDHVGHGVAQLGGVKCPGRAAVAARRGLFPPAAGANHILAAVAVQVPHAQAVREAIGAGNELARRARFADRVHFPRLRRDRCPA